MTKKLSTFFFAVSTLFCFHVAAEGVGELDCINEARALLRNSENAQSHYLGEEVSPSRLNYWDLALAIEKKFKKFEYVEVLSIEHPFVAVLRNGYHVANGLKLRFKAVVGVDSQNFRCRMSIFFDSDSKPDGVRISIYNCKNSQGLTLEKFAIDDFLSSKINKD